jgi:hypothetical protein
MQKHFGPITLDKIRTASFVIVAMMTVIGFLDRAGMLRGMTNGFVDATQIEAMRLRVDGIDVNLRAIRNEVAYGIEALRQDITRLRKDATKWDERLTIQEAKVAIWGAINLNPQQPNGVDRSHAVDRTTARVHQPVGESEAAR